MRARVPRQKPEARFRKRVGYSLAFKLVKFATQCKDRETLLIAHCSLLIAWRHRLPRVCLTRSSPLLASVSWELRAMAFSYASTAWI